MVKRQRRENTNIWQRQYHHNQLPPRPPIVPYGDRFDDPRPRGVRLNDEAIAGGMLVGAFLGFVLIVVVMAVIIGLWML